jgi:hypothetical protein
MKIQWRVKSNEELRMPPTRLAPAITSRFDPPLASDPYRHRSPYASITAFLEMTVSSTRLLIICGKLLKV